MSKTNPKVTVLMPVYNGEKYLNQAIDSILTQTFSDFEFLIIDDGSTDKSAEIINGYQDKRIRCLHNDTNLRLAATLNKGLNNSKGFYIARMDCDDISMPERLEKQVAFLDAHPDSCLCSGNAVSINHDGIIVSKPWWDENKTPVEWILLWGNAIIHPAVMMRKDVLDRKCLMYKTVEDEDSSLWYELVMHGKLVRLNEVLLQYRNTENNTSIVYRIDRMKNAMVLNAEYVTQVAGEIKCDFHKEFTAFYKAIEKPSKSYDIVHVYKWIFLLLKKSKEKWDWGFKDYQFALMDAEKRVVDYFLSLSRKQKMGSMLKMIATQNFKPAFVIIKKYLQDFANHH